METKFWKIFVKIVNFLLKYWFFYEKVVFFQFSRSLRRLENAPLVVLVLQKRPFWCLRPPLLPRPPTTSLINIQYIYIYIYIYNCIHTMLDTHNDILASMGQRTYVYTYTHILGPRGSLTLAEGSRTNICFYCQVCTTWRRNKLHLIIWTQHYLSIKLWMNKQTPFEKQHQSVRLCASKNIILPDEIRGQRRAETEEWYL